MLGRGDQRDRVRRRPAPRGLVQILRHVVAGASGHTTSVARSLWRLQLNADTLGGVIEHPDEFVRALTGITAPWVSAFGAIRPWFRGDASHREPSPVLARESSSTLAAFSPRSTLSSGRFGTESRFLGEP